VLYWKQGTSLSARSSSSSSGGGGGGKLIQPQDGCCNGTPVTSSDVT